MGAAQRAMGQRNVYYEPSLSSVRCTVAAASHFTSFVQCVKRSAHLVKFCALRYGCWCNALFCSGVEDIVRQRPDLMDWQTLADGITPLQLAGIKNRLFIVQYLALSVSFMLPAVYCTVCVYVLA